MRKIFSQLKLTQNKHRYKIINKIDIKTVITKQTNKSSYYNSFIRSELCRGKANIRKKYTGWD